MIIYIEKKNNSLELNLTLTIKAFIGIYPAKFPLFQRMMKEEVEKTLLIPILKLVDKELAGHIIGVTLIPVVISDIGEISLETLDVSGNFTSIRSE